MHTHIQYSTSKNRLYTLFIHTYETVDSKYLYKIFASKRKESNNEVHKNNLRGFFLGMWKEEYKFDVCVCVRVHALHAEATGTNNCVLLR